MTNLLSLFAEFMHIYFWVFLVSLCLNGISMVDEDYRNALATKGTSFFTVVGWTLWFMSWYY